MLRVLAALLCLALVSAAPPPEPGGRPYGVDDLIALESIGQVMIDPGERIIVVERRRAHDQATDYGYGPFETRALSNIYAANLAHPDGLAPLFAQEPGAGYWLGDFSPSGKRLSVFRLAHRRLNLGVVDMATRQVIWLDVAPDLPIAHPAPSWVGEDDLVVVSRQDHRLPVILSIGNGLQSALPPLWASAAQGKVPSATTVTTSAVPTDTDNRAVMRIDLRRGRTMLVASGAITDVAVSSRGAIAIVRTTAPVSPPTDAPIGPDYVALRHVIDVIPGNGVTSGRSIPIASDVLPATLAWDDTGRSLTYVSRMTGRDWRHARWQIATPGSAAPIRTVDVVPVVEGEQSSLTAHARWAGNRLLVEGRQGGGPRAWFAVDPIGTQPTAKLGSGDLVFADRGSAWLGNNGVLGRVSFGGLQTTIATDGLIATGTVPLDPSSVGTRLLDNPTGRMASITTFRAGRRAVAIIESKGLSALQIGMPSTAKLLAFGRHHVVFLAEDAHGVGALSVATDDGRTSLLTRINGFLATRALSRVIQVSSRLSDGHDHAHWLFLPATADSAHPPPLMVMIYPGMILDGGPDPATGPSFFLQPNSVSILVGHGFAVLTPSLPAPGNGPDPLGVMATDVDGAVDAVLKQHLIDPTRMMVFGHSYGGFAALAIGTRSARYRGIVAVSGPYDLATAHSAMTGPDRISLEFGLPLRQDAGWAESGQAGMVVAPWTDPRRYIAKSPMFALDRVTVPVLLLHGETDVVSLEQAERAFMGLARLGRDATLVRYWGEGHTLASPANIRDYWSRVLSWADDHLLPLDKPTELEASQTQRTTHHHHDALQ